jgi:hypothetical protein
VSPRPGAPPVIPVPVLLTAAVSLALLLGRGFVTLWRDLGG